MNTDPSAHAGITMGQRVRMAAVRTAEVFGAAGLLTVVAVEGGAALNLNTPVVQEAEAGTGIPGTVISSSCNPVSNRPQLVIANNTSGRLDFKASVNGGAPEFAGTVEPNDSLTGSATAGDTYVHTADQIPGAQDVVVIEECEEPAPTTTAVPAVTTTIVSTITTTSVPAPISPSTTNNSNVSIPGGEQPRPVATTAAPTPPKPGAGNVNPGPSGNTTTSGQVNSAAKANQQKITKGGGELVRTGSTNEILAKGAAAAIVVGGLVLWAVGRKKQQAAA